MRSKFALSPVRLALSLLEGRIGARLLILLVLGGNSRRESSFMEMMGAP